MSKRTQRLADAFDALEDLYAQLPNVECKGLCHDSCTVIPASELELMRIAERGVEIPPPPTPERMERLIAEGNIPRCPALSSLNTCSVYSVRPFVCRAFGMVHEPGAVHREPMMCDHGCIPDATMTHAELWRIMREIEKLSVEVTGVSRRPQAAHLEAALPLRLSRAQKTLLRNVDPEIANAITRAIRGLNNP